MKQFFLHDFLITYLDLANNEKLGNVLVNVMVV